jgi:hypothetical protein
MAVSPWAGLQRLLEADDPALGHPDPRLVQGHRRTVRLLHRVELALLLLELRPRDLSQSKTHIKSHFPKVSI